MFLNGDEETVVVDVKGREGKGREGKGGRWCPRLRAHYSKPLLSISLLIFPVFSRCSLAYIGFPLTLTHVVKRDNFVNVREPIFT